MATSTAHEFRLPDAGEGLTEAEIVAWRVAPGDRVEVNDIVVEIETAKAVVELPSPHAGTVSALLVAEGETVPVGTPIMVVSGAGPDVPADTPGGGGPAREASPPPPGLPVEPGPGTPTEGGAPVVGAPTDAVPHTGRADGIDDASGPVLVGYGTVHVDDLGGRRRRYGRHPGRPPGDPQERPVRSGPAVAKPPVRRLARDLGIDLGAVRGTGPAGAVTREDVLAGHARPGSAPGGRPGSDPSGRVRLVTPPVVPQPGDVRLPVRGVRRATADAMALSAFTAPHVTEWVQVDVTPTMEFVRRMREDKEFVGLRVSPLLVVAKAVCLAARRNPGVNATWDEENLEIVQRERVHLGIAAATPRGLVVPVIHGADLMHMPQLAQELTDIVATAREGRLQPAQMTGGTLTITNVGVFGVDGGTPILPPGQAAILTMGQIRQLPWVVDGAVVPRDVATLSVSFDHRLVDGELGSAFLTDVAAVLADPGRGLIWA
ncbi:MAG: dihydrolipoamide acetyltransferase family protein [Kineosporiaceae bacterium]